MNYHVFFFSFLFIQGLLPIQNIFLYFFSYFSFQIRIAHFEDIKAANELEAEKYEEQLRNIQKKMQVIIIIIISSSSSSSSISCKNSSSIINIIMHCRPWRVHTMCA